MNWSGESAVSFKLPVPGLEDIWRNFIVEAEAVVGVRVGEFALAY